VVFGRHKLHSCPFSRVLSNGLGTLVSASLLTLTNRWFAEDQRATAVAAVALISLIGAGAALVIGPAFSTEDGQFVDLTL